MSTPDRTQPGLFDPPLAKRARARRRDPDTSHEAAADASTRIRSSQAAVLQLFQAEKAMTDVRLIGAAQDAGVMQSHSGLRTRRRELADAGYIADTGERVKIGSRKHIRWHITDKGLAFGVASNEE